MGIFSSKKKHIIGAQVFRLIEDSGLPDSTIPALLRSILKDTSVAEELVSSKLHDSFRNFEYTYNYAKRPGNYFHGLPDATLLDSGEGITIIDQVIESEVGGSVSIDYAFYMPMNNVHFALSELQDNYGYDVETNEIVHLSATKGFPVYLDKIVAIHDVADGDYPEGDNLGIYDPSTNVGQTPERGAMSAQLSQYSRQQETILSETLPESAEIHYIWEDASGIRFLESFTYDLSSVDPMAEFYQVKYTYLGDSFFWVYSTDQGLHPALDTLFDVAYPGTGSYFPFFLIRDNFEDKSDPLVHDTDEYKSTVKTCGKLGIDFQSFSESVHENPDIDGVQHAAIAMGVPITTEDPVELMYLYEYFNQWVTDSPQISEPMPRSVFRAGATHTAPDRSFAIRVGDGSFAMVLSLSSVTKEFIKGSIGPVGTHTSTTSLSPVGVRGGQESEQVPNKDIHFQKQIDSNTYIEIRVTSPAVRFPADTKHSYGASVNDENALIPLDYTIARRIPASKRQVLYYRSLHLVAVSHVVQKIKWYQTGVFKAILIIVAIIILVISVGTTYQAMGALFATVTAAVIATIIVLIISQIAASFIFDNLVKVIGEDAALILSIILLAFGLTKGFNTNLLPNGLTAQQALYVSTNLSASIGSRVEDRMQELLKASIDFDDYMDSKNSELLAANELINTNDLLDPYMFVGSTPLYIPGETPDQLYNRTIHSSNPGTLVFNFVENFVESSLTLPDINNPSGGALYV